MKQIVDKLNKIAKKINENVELSDRDLIIDSLDSITKAYGGTPNDSTLIVDKLDDIYNNISPAVSGNIEITENGENINVAPYATATVNVSGGGGDFSTAQITFINTGGVNTFYTVSNYIRIDISGEELVIDNAGTWVYTEVTVTVPLYKGSYFLYLDSFDHFNTEVMPTATGDINIDFDDSCIVITGDGTITISGISNGGDIG